MTLARARALLLLFALLSCVPTWTSHGFCLDDAYIHLAYAKSLQLGQGASYNPFDHETGMSSPLWVLLLSLLPLSPAPFLLLKTLGALLHALAALLVFELARAQDAPATTPALRLPLLAGALSATTPLLLQGATSGMEVPLSVLALATTSLLSAQGRYGLAALAAAAAYLARPEALVFVAALGASLSLLRRCPRALVPPLGALAAMAGFGLFCHARSGYFWPNTYYVKGDTFDLAGLRYLAAEILRTQPVVASVTGLYLLGRGALLALRARSALAAVLCAGLLTLGATAVSRTLYPGVLFYQSRHFAIVLWVLPLLAARGLSGLRAPLALALLLPLLGATALLGDKTVSLQLAQERGVRRLHELPARKLAALGARVIGVEGAGAIRYLTPRSTRVVDLMGLNDRVLAHLPGSFFRDLCHLAAQGVTHLAYADPWARDLSRAFSLQPLARFEEPRYAQLSPPQRWRVTVAAVRGLRPDFAGYCASTARTAR